MIDLGFLRGKRFAVLGLGKTGLAAARALVKAGAQVEAWDDHPVPRETAIKDGIPVTDLKSRVWQPGDRLLLSPGIPHTYPTPHPVAEAAGIAGVPMIADIELLALAQRQARFVGITGTNGKSTTTALIGHIVNYAGISAEVGGNLGQPVLDFKPLGRDGVYVIELSSFQLELTHSLHLAAAVLLNLTPDHLERHGGLDGYIAAKRRIFNFDPPADLAVVGVDDELCRALFNELRAAGRKAVPISAATPVVGGVYGDRNMLNAGGHEVLDFTQARALPGPHNRQNAAAAYAVARALGIEPSVIAEGILSFPGLAHRQERIATIEGVTYVNDSKATNADAAARALTSYRRIHWIAGGRPKEGGIDSLDKELAEVRHAYLIGEAAEDFARQLKGRVPFTHCRTLDVAVETARRNAQNDGAGAVVLLSPACASFDQFANFEARGDAFRDMVQAIDGERMGGHP